MFQGFVTLGGSFVLTDLAEDSTGAVADLDAAPTYRVYGPDGFLAGAAGSLSHRDTGTITGASNASPVEITSAGHGLTTGTRVTVSGVGGNSGANGTFTVTVTGADTLTLDSSAGGGAYTTGGSWHVTGLYAVSLDCSAGNGYEAGETYTVLVSGTSGSDAYGRLHSFTVT
jgi:hypothetical protein